MGDEPGTTHSVTLEILVQPWPIALSLSSHLPAGDLISLARANSTLRASLHGFGLAEPLSSADDQHEVRESIYVGLHGTPYWQRLKSAAPYACSSQTHTKGDKVHSCRLCSRTICEACIVRSSFARGKEDTFRNRCRFFCRECWDSGTLSRSQRHPLSIDQQHTSWFGQVQSYRHEDSFCTCTLKDDGFLCLECKDKQNYEAVSNDRLKCHGLGCSNVVGDDYERRRVCLWCNKCLPRHVGSASRQVWNQKIIEARTRNALSRQADLEEYNRRRLKSMRMSRREMRGNEAVEGDPDADLPQFVRHLDSCCNYRNFMGEDSVPSGNAVYNSKRGHWTYSKDFLVRIGVRCRKSKKLKHNHKLRALTRSGTTIFSRTMRQRWREQEYLWTFGLTDLDGNIIGFRSERFEPPLTRERAAHWVALKTRILNMAFVERLQFFQIQATLQLQYEFDLPWEEFRSMLNVWGLAPLWEDTERDCSDQWSGDSQGDSLSRRNTAMETHIDNHAARIIERLVLAGKILPLRNSATGLGGESHWHTDEGIANDGNAADVGHDSAECASSDEDDTFSARNVASAYRAIQERHFVARSADSTSGSGSVLLAQAPEPTDLEAAGEAADGPSQQPEADPSAMPSATAGPENERSHVSHSAVLNDRPWDAEDVIGPDEWFDYDELTRAKKAKRRSKSNKRKSMDSTDDSDDDESFKSLSSDDGRSQADEPTLDKRRAS